MLGAEINLDTRSKRLWTPSSSMYSRFNDTLVLCLTPFAFVLTTKNSSDLGNDISDWVTWSVDQRPKKSRRRLVVPTADQMESSLRVMIYPADYVAR